MVFTIYIKNVIIIHWNYLVNIAKIHLRDKNLCSNDWSRKTIYLIKIVKQFNNLYHFINAYINGNIV